MTLSTAPHTDGLRDDIAQSWHRSAGYGLPTNHPMGDLPSHEVDTASSLAAAARPVLARLAGALEDVDYMVVLADHDGRIVEQFGQSAGVRDRFEACSVRTGVDFSEEAVGTNAIGTTLELRRPVSITSGEHYNEALRSVACIGAPIFHPITRRVLGVLDLSGDDSVTHPLVPRLVQDVVTEIESRLLDASSAAQQRLLGAFRAASPRRARPVLALDDDILLANRPALDLLSSDDLATIRGLVGGCARDTRLRVRLTDGEEAALRVDQVTGTHRGLLVSFDPLLGVARSTAGHRGSKDLRAPSMPESVLVSGPPGSGRTTYAAELAGSGPCRTVPIEYALGDDESAWSSELHAAFADTSVNAVCVEEIGALPDRLLILLAGLLKRRSGPPVVLTSPPVEELSGRAAAIAAGCTRRVRLAPLTERRDELHTLARALIEDIAPGAELRLTPSVLEALGAQAWPGNLSELRHVLEHVCARRSCGDVILRDLPEDYRARVPLQHLGGLALAERAAIVKALGQSEGNKVKAAALLGISRTTLYARIRSLSIPG